MEALDYPGADPLPTGRSVMPLSEFPPDKRAEIGRAVQGDRPPPKWLRLGFAQIVSRAWYEWHWSRGIDPDSRRPKIPPVVRRRVLDRDGLVCGLCHGAVEPDDVHLDHIVPWSLGGPSTVRNLQVTHARCNMRKGARV